MMFSRKKILFNMILCLAIVLSACTMPTPIPPPLILFVSTSGSDDGNDCQNEATPCRTLLFARGKTTPNSTIRMAAGEFIEERGINFNNGVTLVGAGSEQTIIRAVSGDYVLEVGGWRPVIIRDLGIIGRGGGDVGLIGINPYDDGPIGINVSGGASGGVLIENCRVTNNITGIRIQSPVHATINNCVIADNYNGILNRGSLSMDHITFQHNTAGPRRYYSKWGMAFGDSLNAVASISNVTFDNNGAEGIRSFTILNEGGTFIYTGTISHNYGEVRSEGVGMYFEHAEIVENHNAGITYLSGQLTVRSSIIKDNDFAGIDVYGEYGDSEGVVEISKTAIIGNHKGGLIIHTGRHLTISVENTTISGNLPWLRGVGAGIHLGQGRLTLTNSTVAFNEGVGVSVSGPLEDPARLTEEASVIALNAGEECIGNSEDSFISILGYYYYFDGRESKHFFCDESWTQTTLGLGPLTEEAGTWIHPLQPGSILIDAPRGAYYGVPIDVPGYPDCFLVNDQRGYARPFGVNCDVGAYESQYSTAIAPLEFVTPPATAIAEQAQVTATKNANCREGPGTAYEITDTLFEGQTAKILGRNQENTWWQILGPGFGKLCWVSYVTVKMSGTVDAIPIPDTSSIPIESPPDNEPLPPEAPSLEPPPPPPPLQGCYVYDKAKKPVCTVPCPANPQPGGTCTP